VTRARRRVPARLSGLAVRRASWRLDVLAVVFVGGCLGGAARYAATSAGRAPSGGFPWATFAVNTSGAFVLAAVIVAAAGRGRSRYLRPLLGTGFCGAFTTFSSVVVAADQMFVHGHAATALAYLLATIVGGLVAAWLGWTLIRAVTTRGGLS
jgi:CrcB protein